MSSPSHFISNLITPEFLMVLFPSTLEFGLISFRVSFLTPGPTREVGAGKTLEGASGWFFLSRVLISTPTLLFSNQPAE